MELVQGALRKTFFHSGRQRIRKVTLAAALLGIIGLTCAGQAQTPTEREPIGTIEFYGLKRVSEASVRQALQLKEGDSPPGALSTVDEIRKRLRALPGIEDAQTNSVCCVEGKTAFFVGIQEKGARTLRFKAAPQGKAFLPKAVVQAGEEFQAALMEAVRHGDAGEDDSQGYSMMHYPAAAAVQQRFLIFATRDPQSFQDVLLHSSDAVHRALAAQILGYAETENQEVVNDLLKAMTDPDSTVRNNAMRALAVRATYVQNNPNSKIKIPFDPFVRMLTSLDWTDRNKAGFALIQLSLHRDTALLKSLRKDALPALLDMAHWTRSGYGQPAFILLGRIAGLSDEVIMTSWQNHDYAKVMNAFKDR